MIAEIEKENKSGRRCGLTTPVTSSSRPAPSRADPQTRRRRVAANGRHRPAHHLRRRRPRSRVTRPGSTLKTARAPRSNDSVNGTRPCRLRPRFLPSGNGPQIPRCYAAWKPVTGRILRAGSKQPATPRRACPSARRTPGRQRPRPERRPRHAEEKLIENHWTVLNSHLDRFVDGTVHITSPQVTTMIKIIGSR